MQNKFQSWGNLSQNKFKELFIPNRCNIQLPKTELNILAFGNGRSYGDVAYNDNGLLIDSQKLNYFIDFDRFNGVLYAESGVTLYEILQLIVGTGWFLSVTPGTQFVTLGGAVANDVHGKNHHKFGSFGNFVKEIELVRSNNEVLICSSNVNQDLFYATIGGLGLTGLITKVKIQLLAIQTPFINNSATKFANLSEYFELNNIFSEKSTYNVAWIDCLASSIGRGIFYTAEHVQYIEDKFVKPRKNRNYIIQQPFSLINNLSLRLFNYFYYNRTLKDHISSYEEFFYPLDSIYNWNRIYGRNGFYQYQCVIPTGNDFYGIKEILNQIKKYNQGSFLAVLKTFGNISSGGLLSFPRAGTTLALDFPNVGDKVKKLFKVLDQIVMDTNGAIYPAKDSLMSASLFQLSYPNLTKFLKFKDPQFNSNFWQRVMET
jgi:FAD/FMN-containing dehydrogenase